MKKNVLLALALVALTGCKLSHNLTQAQVATILSDAGYGMALGCDELWLTAPVCTVGIRILSDAQTAVGTAATDGWAAAAKAVLMVEENKLAPDSRLRPYFDAAIILL